MYEHLRHSFVQELGEAFRSHELPTEKVAGAGLSLAPRLQLFSVTG